MNIADLVATYPRRRPPLGAADAKVYEQEYRRNRSGAGAASALSQAAEAWMHRQVSRRGAATPVLEIGAGTLNHLQFEQPSPYDIVEPFTALFEDSPHIGHVRDIYSDIDRIPAEKTYARIISIAVLEHLEDLPRVLARGGLLLDAGGCFQCGIPSEGGALWGLAWRTTTGLAYRLRTGLSYATLMRHEHVNNAPEIIALVRHFFAEVSVRRFPLPFHHASFYAYIHAQRPRREVCSGYLAERSP